MQQQKDEVVAPYSLHCKWDTEYSNQSLKKQTHFRYFSLRVISFRKQNIPFRFIAKHAKLNFFSRYFALLIFVSVSLRFTSRNEGHPITHTTGQLQLSIVIDTAESRSVVSLSGFCFLLGMVVHQPFSLFLRPFILFYVNLCAHLETQSLWLKCFDLWQAGYNPTGSLLISLGSIEIVAFCIGRIFVQRMVNRTLCLVPIDPCVVQYHSAMWL